MVHELLGEEANGRMKVYWTHMWQNGYGRLFAATPAHGTIKSPKKANLTEISSTDVQAPQDVTGELTFKFSPDWKSLIDPPLSDLPPGSDGWALHKHAASVTPLHATFAEPAEIELADVEDRLWVWRNKL
jgi:tubulin---tyrosine ligase